MSCSNRYDWDINVGESVSWALIVKDETGAAYNLTGYGAKSQIRSYPNGDLILELSNTNGRLIVSDTGRIDVSISPAATSGLQPQQAKYDLFIIQSGYGASEKLIHGDVSILSSITII